MDPPALGLLWKFQLRALMHARKLKWFLKMENSEWHLISTLFLSIMSLKFLLFGVKVCT